MLDAAEAEFLSHGYAGASTNAILRRFGGSKATMFRHFATKEAMFAAVVDRIAWRMTGRADLDSLGNIPPDEWLHGFGRAGLRAALDGDALFVARLIVAEGARFPGAREQLVVASVSPILARLEQQLSRWSHEGKIFLRDAVRDAGHFLDLTVSGWMNRRMFGATIDMSEGAVDAHPRSGVMPVLAGLRPR